MMERYDLCIGFPKDIDLYDAVSMEHNENGAWVCYDEAADKIAALEAENAKKDAMIHAYRENSDMLCDTIAALANKISALEAENAP
jgi:hypothetical protein